jgi:hypothetical protein
MTDVADGTEEVTRLIDTIWEQKAPKGKIYALLDAAASEWVYELVEYEEQPYCLYTAAWARDLAEVAPYLVELQRDGDLISSLLDEGWGSNWGILLESAASLEDLLAHLRKLLIARVDSAPPRRLYFRYYDPRVLRAYLDHGDAAEQTLIFGPVTRYWLEDSDAESWNLIPYVNARPSRTAGAAAQQLDTELIQALWTPVTERFVEQALADLAGLFAKRYQELGEQGMRDYVRDGIGQAASYGFVSEQDVFKYIAFTLMYDLDVHTDPALGWARDILNAELAPDQKLDQLYNIARTHRR